MKSLKQLIQPDYKQTQKILNISDHFVDINEMAPIDLNKGYVSISQEIKLNIKKQLNSKIEKLLEDCVSEEEWAPYGDTCYCSGSFYSEETIEECRESAKEKLIEEFKEDPEEFLSACEGDYDFIEVLNFINQL